MGRFDVHSDEGSSSATIEILTNGGFAGYGNMSPSTWGGQIFCVFFALFGIPLNVVVLNKVGKYMLSLERNISDFLQRKLGGKVGRSPLRVKCEPQCVWKMSNVSLLYKINSFSLHRHVYVSLYTWFLTSVERFSSSSYPWLYSSCMRDGATHRPFTTVSSPSVLLVLEILWQVKLYVDKSTDCI